jgi:hypothetical protein
MNDDRGGQNELLFLKPQACSFKPHLSG